MAFIPTKAKNLKKMAEQIIEGGGLRWRMGLFFERLAVKELSFQIILKHQSVVMSQWYGYPVSNVSCGYIHIH